MSNTPGQDSQPAKALQDQLIEFMLETALRQKRFQNLIGLMEQVTAEARAKKGDDWRVALEQLRKDLAASDARLMKELTQTRGPSPANGSPELAEIKTKLLRLETQMAALLRAMSGGGAGPALSAAAAAELTRQSSPDNGGPGTPHRAGRTFWPGWMRSPLFSLFSLLVAAAALAALVMTPGLVQQAPPAASGARPSCTSEQVAAGVACAPAEATGPAAAAGAPAATPAPPSADSAVPAVTESAAESAHAPSAQAMWDIAWGSALVQPAICPNDAKKGRVPFARCVCGELGPAASLSADGAAGAPVKGLETQCPLNEQDTKWNNRLALTALQAVLMSAKRLEGKAPGRADGDLGEHTVAAIKLLGSCQSLAQTEGRALAVLESKGSAADERGTAALKLLAALKADPSCLNPDSPGAAGGAAAPAAHPSPRHP